MENLLAFFGYKIYGPHNYMRFTPIYKEATSAFSLAFQQTVWTPLQDIVRHFWQAGRTFGMGRGKYLKLRLANYSSFAERVRHKLQTPYLRISSPRNSLQVKDFQAIESCNTNRSSTVEALMLKYSRPMVFKQANNGKARITTAQVRIHPPVTTEPPSIHACGSPTNFSRPDKSHPSIHKA